MKKIIGILILTLLITSTVLPVVNSFNERKNNTSLFSENGDPPTCEITSPNDGDSFCNEIICVSAVASDPDGGSPYITFECNGDFGYDAAPPYEHCFQAQNWPDGQYTITITAEDDEDLTCEDSIIIYIDCEECEVDICIPSLENETYICENGNPAVEADPPGGAWEDAYFDELDCCGTNAQWVWYNENGQFSQSGECVWFCNDFNLRDCPVVEGAKLIYTADDAITFELNNQVVHSDSGNEWFWKDLHTYEFEPSELAYFNQGSNTLRVQICDIRGSYAGGIWCLQICCDDKPCNPCVKIDKKVWDQNHDVGEWVDEIEACVNDKVIFKITIYNCGNCNINNFEIVDDLPDYLEYVDDSSTIAGNQIDDPDINQQSNILTWNYDISPVIQPGGDVSLEFQASVQEEGSAQNCAEATVFCEGCEGSDSAMDCGATVIGIDCGGCVDIYDDLSCPPIAWWPLDSPNIGQDIVGSFDAYVSCGQPEPITGKVDGGCRFKNDYFEGSLNLGVIRTHNEQDPFELIGEGDFTIDAWIYPENMTTTCQTGFSHCPERIIIDNHYYLSEGEGVTFLVKNEGWNINNKQWDSMELGIIMFDQLFLTDNAPIVRNEWQHVAVTVSRPPGGTNRIGTFYLNGNPIGNFNPVMGNLYCEGFFGFPRLDIGHAAASACGYCAVWNDFFNGLLDEIEIFDCCLNENDIKKLYQADSEGKCNKQYISKMTSNNSGETWGENVNVDVGDIVRFRINIVNDGKTSLNNVEIRDTLPNCLEYVKGSADPIEPIVNGDKLIWNYGNIVPGDTETILYDALILNKPLEPAQLNLVEEYYGEGILLSSDTATVNIGKTTPDLKCTGAISWTKVEPGDTVKGNFTVENIGESESELIWDIASLPEWGNWTIEPYAGENLKPEEGPVEVEVEVEAPDEKDEFTGEIIITNRENPDDYEVIQVSLSTPKNKSLSILNPWLFRLIQRFPILESLLLE